MSQFAAAEPSPPRLVLDEDDPTLHLDEVETRVVRARIRASGLGAALQSAPLDRTVHASVRDYMDTDSEADLHCWAALVSRGREQLRPRFLEVMGALIARRAREDSQSSDCVRAVPTPMDGEQR